MSKYTMPAMKAPNRLAYKVAVPTQYGVAVKFNGEQDSVARVAAATDKAIGILQNATTVNDEAAEVALPGGGASAKLGGTVAYGDELGFAADGRLVKVGAASDRVIAVAFSDGVANDLIPVEVVAHKAVGTQA